MATQKDVLIAYGGEAVGKGLVEIAKQIDIQAGKATAPAHERPSTWIAVAGAVGLPAYALSKKAKSPWDLLAALVGGYLFTHLFDVLKEELMVRGLALPPIAPRAVVVAGPAAETAPAAAPAAEQAAAPAAAAAPAPVAAEEVAPAPAVI
jgi:hypothetical protein